MLQKLPITRYQLLLILIVIIAAFFRLYNITQTPPGLYPDEAMNGNNLLEAIKTGDFKVFYPENNGREGLFMNIQALSVLRFGNEPWALRIPSALFGILTVLGLYFLTKELFRKAASANPSRIPPSIAIALLSSFFLAASFWHLNFSRIGFRAIMAPFFAIWALYSLLRALRKAENSNSFWGDAILSGAAWGLGFYSYIAFRIMPALVLIPIAFAWMNATDGKTRKRIALATGSMVMTAIILFAPLGLYFLENPQDFMGRTSQVSVFSSPTAAKDLSLNIAKTVGMFFVIGDYNWRHNFAGKPGLSSPVAFLFAIGILISLKSFIRDSALAAKDSFLILFGWLFLAALPVIISNEGLPHALRAILMLPPALILAGYGGIWFYQKIRDAARQWPDFPMQKIFGTICLVTLIAIPAETYINYFARWAKNPEVQGAFAADYLKIGRELNSLPRETPKYVIVGAGGTDVRGLPMPTQTTMFITDTFLPEDQKKKNIFYILAKDQDKIPAGAYTAIIR